MRPSNEWMDDRLEAYVDGDLPPDELQAFAAAMQVDPAWQAEVARARRVRAALKHLPQPACPPAVTHAVMVEVEQRAQAARRQNWTRLIDRLLAATDGLLRPALTMAVLVALVVTAARLGAPSGELTTARQLYTQAEVERAAVQVRWALGYLADVGETTGEAVQEEVLREHVTRPVQNALDDVLTDDVGI